MSAERGADEPLVNDAGRPVSLGRAATRDVLYCGIMMGDGDGYFDGGDVCRPPSTFQCEPCARLQSGARRPHLLLRRFPSLAGAASGGESIAVAALRGGGGSPSRAASALSGLGAAQVEPLGAAFPPPPGGTDAEDTYFGSLFGEPGEERRDTDAFLAAHSGPGRGAAGDGGGTERDGDDDDEEEEARAGAIRAAAGAPLPPEVARLGEECRRFPRLAPEGVDVDRNGEAGKDGEDAVIVTNGHRMVRIVQEETSGGDGAAGKGSVRCVLCAGALGSEEAGSYRCQSCLLCEGCVQSGAVVNCPKLLNGGYLHTHPLSYGSIRSFTCDVRLSETCLEGDVSWRCKACDFNVCPACIRQKPPEGYDRKVGTVDGGDIEKADGEAGGDGDVGPDGNGAADSGDDGENSDAPAASSDDASEPFDEVAAERGAAAQWEGAYEEDFAGEVVVGTGEIEAAIPSVPPPASLAQERAARPDSRRAEGRLTEDAEEALQLFLQRRSGGAPGATAEAVAAADLTHVEGILHRANAVDDLLTSRALCDAIAAGRLEIAGTLLLSQAFAPRAQPKAAAEGGDGNPPAKEELMCWCGDVIDAQTAPSGAVGCLGGHAMHASCAADLLLSGGSCPSCRQPLYYPKIPRPEAKAALDIAKGEAKLSQEREEEKLRLEIDEMKSRGVGFSLSTGDYVRISSDAEACRRTQLADPRVGGWADDMAPCVGQEGRVIETITAGDQDVAVRVRTGRSHSLVVMRQEDSKQCTECHNYGPSTETGRRICSKCDKCEVCCQRLFILCPSAGEEWVWSQSLLQPIALASAMGKEADKEKAAVKAAEQHLVRLRAELKAIQAAREAIKADSEKLKPPQVAGRQLSSNSSAAVHDLLGTVSHADWERARHLLLLARQWGDSEEARRTRAQLYSSVRKGELDSVARMVRRFNASRTAEEAKWADAVAETREYIVHPTAHVDLRAFPSAKAPKTGYSLGPGYIFSSKREQLDEDGNVWILVDDSDFPDPKKFVGSVIADDSATLRKDALVGACVQRGVDWGWGDQDGGAGNKGIIVHAREGTVVVRWGSKPEEFDYPAGQGVYALEFVGGPPPPPQGWLCERPGGHKSPPVVLRSRSSLRCFCCGDGLVPPKLGRDRFAMAKGASVQKGDSLLVAATLEPVIVERCAEGQIFCSFPSTDSAGIREVNKDGICSEDATIWYRPEDLVFPESRQAQLDDDDVVEVEGKSYTRRELVLLFQGDEVAARREWKKVMRERRLKAPAVPRDDETSFASCARGHLLHARCLQGALLAGKCCPAPGCTEPLWVPQVRQQRADETSCRGDHRRAAETEAEVLRVATELAGHAELVSARAAGGSGPTSDNGLNRAGFGELKMCPTCCAGPLFNENCSDMQTHHGECSVISIRGHSSRSCTPEGTFRVFASDIAEKLVQMSSTESVADVLPRCPTHNVLVIFNGCMACGHLFTDTSWDDLPKYDEKAMALLELDKKKRKAAELLANQIRIEAAMLQFERDAMWDELKGGPSSGGEDTNAKIPEGRSIMDDLPPLPPPVHKYKVRPCGQDCTRQHFGDGDCLVCGRDYGNHSGHTCWEGHRGRWVTL